MDCDQGKHVWNLFKERWLETPRKLNFIKLSKNVHILWSVQKKGYKQPGSIHLAFNNRITDIYLWAQESEGDGKLYVSI